MTVVNIQPYLAEMPNIQIDENRKRSVLTGVMIQPPFGMPCASSAFKQGKQYWYVNRTSQCLSASLFCSHSDIKEDRNANIFTSNN